MTELEERVAALEGRLDALTLGVAHATELGLTARDAHRQNVELLNALRQTQVEQGQVLTEHGQMLAEHGQILARHDGRMDAIDGKLGVLTVGMHTIESLIRILVEDQED